MGNPESETTQPEVSTRSSRRARPARFGPRQREVRAFLELFALAGLAFAQPALDLMSKNSEIFFTREATALQIILFGLIVISVPPALLWGAEVAAGLVLPRLRRWLHAFIAACLLGVFAMQLAKSQSSFGPTILIFVGCVTGLAAGVLVLRFDAVRQWLRYLAFAPIAFLLIFLFASQTTSLLLGNDPKSTSGAQIGNPKRIVFIIADEFPTESLLDGSGSVDGELFPHFASLAAESTWYRNMTTIAPYTQVAVPAIFTGDYPEVRNAQPISRDHPDSLFTLLGGQYEMNVTEAITRLCSPRICTGSRPSGSLVYNEFGLVRDAVDLWRSFVSPVRTNSGFLPDPRLEPSMPIARKFVYSLRPGTEKMLDFLHVELPHQPWRYVGTWQDAQLKKAMPGAPFLEWNRQSSADAGRVRHLLSVQATDKLIGLVVTKLKAMGAYDDTLIVVTADHGIAFTERQPLRSVSAVNYPQIIWTPTFIKYPGQKAGLLDERPAESIDIFPTIADVLETKLPWKVDGRSLLAEPRPSGPRRVYEWTEWGFPVANTITVGPGGYAEVSGPEGYAEVLRSSAARPGGDPGFRIYRRGQYGDLIGKPVAPFLAEVPGGPTNFYIWPDVFMFEAINVNQPKIPWTYTSDYIEGQKEHEITVAIGVNGVIGGFATSLVVDDKDHGYYWMSLPPSLFRNGKNIMTAYAVTGPASSPSFDPILVNQYPQAG